MNKLCAIILCVLLLVSMAACASDPITPPNPNEQNEQNANGNENKVPSPPEEYLLYKESYTDSTFYYLYEYNEKNHVVSKIGYKDGEIFSNIVNTYTYNSDGSYSYLQADTVQNLGEYVYRYDARGNLVERVENPNGYTVTHTYIYDENDRMIESKIESKTNIRSWIVYTYDEKGCMTKEQYLYDDRSPARWNEHVYDENGKHVQTFYYTEEGDLDNTGVLFKWEYTYDEYGRVLTERKIDAERGGKYVNTSYEYDQAGGICKMTELHNKTIYEYKPASQFTKK